MEATNALPEATASLWSLLGTRGHQAVAGSECVERLPASDGSGPAVRRMRAILASAKPRPLGSRRVITGLDLRVGDTCRMRIGDIFRDPKSKEPSVPVIGGLPNLYHATRYGAGRMIPFAAGINRVKATQGKYARRPVVIIRSSPHKAGSMVTPWQDRLEPDRGHVRYFGDNKFRVPQRKAEDAPGNFELLELFAAHTSPDREIRMAAAPLVFFETVTVNGRLKGHVKFQGYGVLTDVELVTQVEPVARRPFPNYVFNCIVMTSAPEAEEFDWGWVNLRRDPDASHKECLRAAPAAWQEWVAAGSPALPRVRRRVATLLTTPTAEQRPIKGSREQRILSEVCAFYADRKARFEGLAEIVAEQVLRGPGADYRRGWITRASGDRGIDFVGRLDVGNGFSSAPIVVLGQAKCERVDAPTGGVHIARTVARLKRGWIGVYVTTSFFSVPVQEELFEDRYPVVLIHGLRLAEEINALVIERKLNGTAELLKEVDGEYESRLDFRDPEEILFTI